MKKLLLAFLVSFVLCGGISAQTTPEKKKATTTSSTTSKAKAGPTKKDGTPDMRYKENKAAKEAKATGPVKKDGTPDKRYKANKEKS